MNFKFSEGFWADCNHKATRSGFKHEGTLYCNGEAVQAKICYSNRTWERFQFESLLRKLMKKARLSIEDRKVATEFIDSYREPSSFDTIVASARIGELMCSSQAEKNSWKRRMMQAGLGDRLSFPANWDALSEDEKSTRLDAALNSLKQSI